MYELEHVKSGDKVLLIRSGYASSLELHYVDKVYKLHITLVGGDKKYKRSSGYPVGSSYSYYNRAYLQPFDQKTWDEYKGEQRLKGMRHAVKIFDWGNAEIELINKVYELLPKVKNG
jgi:hypothetical protein